METQTPESRLSVLEKSEEDCQRNYDGQFEAVNERLANMEAWKDKVLLVGIGLLLTGFISIGIALANLLAKK